MNCRKCLCPLTQLKGKPRGKEKRAYCSRCREEEVLPPSGYGTRTLKERLKRREEKRLWAESKRDLIKQRRKERLLADPEKYRAAQREYKRRYEQRLKATKPPICETELPRGTE